MIQRKEIKGLKSHEVIKNRKLFGANSIKIRKKNTKLNILISQFTSPLVIILILAAGITLSLNEINDFVAIISVIVINSILGYSQEAKAQNTLIALQNIIQPRNTVIRDGNEIEVDSTEIVVGDIVKLKLGDKVPADGVVINGSNLYLNESVLTGESLPVEKVPASRPTIDDQIETESKVFMGTIVTSGCGYYSVAKVGKSTEFGKIAERISTEKESKTPLQNKLNVFSRKITGLIIILTLIIFVASLSNQKSLEETLILSVSLAVSAIPEGLVIALTVILSLGMHRLLKRKALIRKLVVAETLGSVTTICLDKTGTITEGEMKVIATYFKDEQLAASSISMCNKSLNPVDSATKEWLERSSKKLPVENELDSLPFNSSNKFSASLTNNHLYIVGAPEILLKKSHLDYSERNDWINKIDIESEKGRRIIGVGYINNDKHAKKIKEMQIQDIIWLGYIVIEDPIRKSVRSAFTDFQDAGIDIKVITGDQKSTALSIMNKSGISLKESEIMSGNDINNYDEEEFAQIVKNIKLFYRTTPDQKFIIVEALKENGEIVAMMGDGVNDAPALKKADIGIVVENATEVSKETADIILLDSNINTITAAIEEGRSIFENIRKVITYLLSDSSAEIMLILLSLLLGLPLPLLPLQILFINIIADGLPDIALSFEKSEKGLMKDKPRSKNEPLINREMIGLIFIIGIIVNIFIFIIYVYMLNTGYDISKIRSIIFLMLGIDSLFYIYSVRSLRKNIWQMDIFSNRVLNLSVLFGITSMFLAFNIPLIRDTLELVELNLQEVLIVALLSIVQIISIELMKWFYWNRKVGI